MASNINENQLPVEFDSDSNTSEGAPVLGDGTEIALTVDTPVKCARCNTPLTPSFNLTPCPCQTPSPQVTAGQGEQNGLHSVSQTNTQPAVQTTPPATPDESAPALRVSYSFQVRMFPYVWYNDQQYGSL